MSTYIPLFPPLLAIVLAISTRKAYVAIFSGIVVGAVILAPSLADAIQEACTTFMLTVVSPGTVQSLIFILMIGAIIHLLQRSGGINRALYLLSVKRQLIKGRTQAQLLAFVAGLLMCLEGIGSMMVVGVVGRPLFKRYDISPEKLAFIANSTGAPIAWLLPISSAGLFLTSLVQAQIDQGVIQGSAIGYVLHAIPYQLYTLLILLSVPLLALLQHDFDASVQITEPTHVQSPINKPNTVEPSPFPLDAPNAHSLWLSMAPLYLLVLSIVLMAAVTGNISQAIYCSGYVSLLGSLCVFRAAGIPLSHSLKWVMEGAKGIFPVVCILLLAFTFSRVIGALGTGEVIAQLVSGNVAPLYLPAMIFLTGMAISFSTGSSGATVSILLPIVIPMAVSMDFSVSVVIGAVISGAVFGDQSSPISDSVIVAASAAACTPERHFNTQLPIVTKAAAVALAGYFVLGYLNALIQ